jgi:hypothetical protein
MVRVGINLLPPNLGKMTKHGRRRGCVIEPSKRICVLSD